MKEDTSRHFAMNDADADKWGVSAHLDSSSSSDSDGSTDLRACPAGVFSERSRKAAWAGSGMEDEHQKMFNNTEDAAPAIKEQFYNTDINKGYQYKTVKRQKTGTEKTTVVDMTGATTTTTGAGTTGARLSEEERETPDMVKKAAIKSEGVRLFKREIARIIKSTSA